MTKFTIYNDRTDETIEVPENVYWAFSEMASNLKGRIAELEANMQVRIKWCDQLERKADQLQSKLDDVCRLMAEYLVTSESDMADINDVTDARQKLYAHLESIKEKADG